MIPKRRDLRTLVRVDVPGAPLPDGDGGYTEAWTPASPPTWWCGVSYASALEGQRGSTVEASATKVLTGDWHPGISVLARLWVPDPDGAVERPHDVVSVQPVDQRRFAMIVTVSETVDG
jgi:hypothetical protein